MEKIRILFVHHRLLCGGTEQALYDLINLLDKDKFDVTVFVQNDDGTWDQKFREAGIRLIYDYSCRRATWNPIVKAGNIRKRLRTVQAYRRDGEGLLNVCWPQGADIVVSYATSAYEKMMFLPGGKTVKFIHGNLDTNQMYREEILSNLALLHRFDRIVCVSEDARQSFCRQTGITEKVSAHWNPINSQQIRALAQRHVDLPAGEPIVCAVGRLSYEKGFERLIVIHRKLLDQGIRHKLVIVGDGGERSYVEREIIATETQDTVILAGYQENPYPYIVASRFLVCSSYTEGLCLTAMEALCLGIPVVASVSSVRELLGQIQCGLITETDNASLEMGIRKMLTDEPFYRQVKLGAQMRSAAFDGQQMVSALEDLFLQLAGEKREGWRS